MLSEAGNEASLVWGLRIINQNMKIAILSTNRKVRPEAASSHRRSYEKLMKQKNVEWTDVQVTTGDAVSISFHCLTSERVHYLLVSSVNVLFIAISIVTGLSLIGICSSWSLRLSVGRYGCYRNIKVLKEKVMNMLRASVYDSFNAGDNRPEIWDVGYDVLGTNSQQIKYSS